MGLTERYSYFDELNDCKISFLSFLETAGLAFSLLFDLTVLGFNN